MTTMNEQILRIIGVGEINKLDDISDRFVVYPTEEEILDAIKTELMTKCPNVENSLIALMYQKTYDRAKSYAEGKGLDLTYFTTHSGYYVNGLDSHFYINGDQMYNWQSIKYKINEMAGEE